MGGALTELIVVGVAYTLSIVGLFVGPKHLFAWLGVWKDEPPPWYLTRVVYAPALGVSFLCIAHWLLGGFGVEVDPILTPHRIVETALDKYDIVFLILSFAYLSISLDHSGFFEFCSLRIVLFADGDGLRLFVFLYLLCSVLTFFTSNDIVIISMTPIIFHIGKHAKITNLIPLLISQFIAANTLSMGLFIGSPTNIVLGEAASMTFLDYLAWMILPSIVACLVTLGMLVLVFHVLPIRGVRMQASFETPERARSVRSNGPMWVKLAIFVVCLIFLTISSFIGARLWIICLVTALVMLAIDVGLLARGREDVLAFLLDVNTRMPWPIAPFVICFFSIVSVLSAIGFTESVANSLVSTCEGSTFKTSMVFGYASAVLANLMNDIPSTVFWADMVPYLQNQLSAPEFRAAICSLIVGVNPGCYLSVIGALAGLMWMNIIKTSKDEDQVTPSGWDLSLYGALVIVPVIFFTCLTVHLQVSVVFF